jgi:hypothetical protein
MKILEETQSEVEPCGTIGQKIMVECPDKPGTYRLLGEVIDQVQVVSRGYRHVIQRVHELPEAREEGEEFAYRFGCHAIATEGKRKFGQFAPVLSERELRRLLKRAHERHWPVFPY